MLVKGAPVFNNLVLFQLMTDGLKGTKPLITCNHKHFKQINSKIQIIMSHCNFNMLKILQKSSIKIVFFFMKNYSIKLIFLNRMKFGLLVVHLSSTDYQDKDNGQHTGSVIPRFGYSSWGIHSSPSICLIACIKIQKQIWFISTIIANKASKLVCGLCHDSKSGLLIEVILVGQLPTKIQITLSAVGLFKEIFADKHIKFTHKVEFMVMDCWRLKIPCLKTTWNINWGKFKNPISISKHKNISGNETGFTVTKRSRAKYIPSIVSCAQYK